MVAKRQATENSWAQIDVALRRRHDLIPALVESVKGYATHERTTFEAVTEARTEAIAAEGPPRRAGGGGRSSARPPIGCWSSPRPTRELEASTNFSQLQTDLRETEDQIAITRRVYNDTVETYNTLIQVFPARDRRAALRLRAARVLRRPGGGRGDAAGRASPPARPDRSLGAALAALAACAGVLALAAPARSSADITDADVALRLAPNGDLLVTEQLHFDYDGTLRGLLPRHRPAPRRADQRRLGEPGRQSLPARRQHRRSAATTGPGVFGVTLDATRAPGSSGTTSATDEQRTTVLSYRVRDAVVAYDDVLDIGWAVWGSEWDFDLDHLTASFTNPALDPDDPLYRVWGHPRDVEGETVRGEGRATLEAERRQQRHRGRDSGDDAARPERPPIPAPARPRATGCPRSSPRSRRSTTTSTRSANRTKRFIADHALLLALAIAALAALAAVASARPAWRASATSACPKYLPEPPDDATPALAYGLAHEGGDSTNTVLATLLDLVDRGYYETERGDDRRGEARPGAEAEGRRPAADRRRSRRTSIDVLEFFDQLLDGETVAISEMKDKVPKHSEVWRGRWERMTEKLDAAESGELAWDRDLRWATLARGRRSPRCCSGSSSSATSR